MDARRAPAPAATDSGLIQTTAGNAPFRPAPSPSRSRRPERLPPEPSGIPRFALALKKLPWFSLSVILAAGRKQNETTYRFQAGNGSPRADRHSRIRSATRLRRARTRSSSRSSSSRPSSPPPPSSHEGGICFTA